MGRRSLLLLVAVLLAAVGTTLVFLYVQGADQRALGGQREVRVIVATQPIDAGTTVAEAEAAGSFELETVAEESLAEGALAETAPVADQVLLAPMFPGEQLLRAKVGQPQQQERLPIPEGRLAMSFELSDPARVADFVAPGSEVAVFVTSTPPGSTEGGQTALLLDRVTVLATGATTTTTTTTTSGSGQQQTSTIPRTLLTLALDQDQAQRMVFASQTGQLYFGLLTETSEVAPGPGTSASTLFGD